MSRIKKPKWVQLTKENFCIGAVVRVRPDIERPRYGWGDVKPLEEGVISNKHYPSLDEGGFFKCDFPNHNSWSAQLEEMEIKI